MTDTPSLRRTANRPITVEAVHQAFRDAGEDPTLLAPEFIRFWVANGKTPGEIVAIATNARFQLEQEES